MPSPCSESQTPRRKGPCLLCLPHILHPYYRDGSKGAAVHSDTWVRQVPTLQLPLNRAQGPGVEIWVREILAGAGKDPLFRDWVYGPSHLWSDDHGCDNASPSSAHPEHHCRSWSTHICVRGQAVTSSPSQSPVCLQYSSDICLLI